MTQPRVLELAFIPNEPRQVRLLIELHDDRELLELLRSTDVVAWTPTMKPNGHPAPARPARRVDGRSELAPCPKCGKEYSRSGLGPHGVRCDGGVRPRRGPLTCAECGVRLTKAEWRNGKPYCSAHVEAASVGTDAEEQP